MVFQINSENININYLTINTIKVGKNMYYVIDGYIYSDSSTIPIRKVQYYSDSTVGYY